MDVSMQLKERQEVCSRELAVKQAVLQVKKNDLVKAKEGFKACVSDKDKIKAEEQALEAQVRKLNISIDNTKKSISELERLIASAQKELSGVFAFSFGRKKELKAKIDANERKLSQEKSKLEKLLADRSKLDRERKTGLLESMECRVTEQENLIVALEKEVSEIECDIERIMGELAEINLTIQNQIEEAKRAESVRLAEEAREAEEARIAEEARLAEEAKKAEEDRLAEEKLLAELKEKEAELASVEVTKVSEEPDEVAAANEMELKKDIFHAITLFGEAKTDETAAVIQTPSQENLDANNDDDESDEEVSAETLSFYEAILLLRSAEECWNFFGELIGPKEYQKLEQRAQLAKLLDRKATYNEVHEMTGASTATISRVNAVLSMDDEFHSVIMKNRDRSNESAKEYFGELVLNLKNMEECKHFFSCLCSPVECQAMELRFNIASHLYQGKTYVQVTAETGASSATVGRVKSVIDNDYSLIRSVLERAEVTTDVIEDEPDVVVLGDVTPALNEVNKKIQPEIPMLYYQLTDVDAAGYEDEGLGFVLKKGSKVRVEERITCSAVTRRLRREYAGAISDAGILLEDIILKSVNEATNFCAFGTASSTLIWKDKSGTTLRDLRNNNDENLEEARLAEEARKAEEARLVEEARKVEEARLAEEARKAEEARLAEEARKAEEAHLTEDVRLADETRCVVNASGVQNKNENGNRNIDFDNIAIEFLGLSVRSYNCLKRANVSLVGQMMSMTEDELQAIKNMGKKSINEILDVQNKIRRGEIDFSSVATIGGGLIITDIGPIRMIEKANPSLVGKKIGEVYFKDRMGMRQSDCLIDELGFSVRTLNCLKRESISCISEVAFSEYDKISQIKNMGKVSIDEILEYLKTSVEYSVENDANSEKVEEYYEQIKRSVLERNQGFDWERYERSIKSSLIELVVHGENTYDDLSVVIQEVVCSEIFLSEVEKDIVEIINSNSKEVSREMLFKNFPVEFRECGLEEKVLNSLEQNGIIEQFRKGFRLRLPSISEWLVTLADNRRQAFELRLEGKTLQEAGEAMNLTRERVRQLVDKACRLKPRLREDDFGYWYSKYDCDAEVMEIVFGVDATVSNYLGVVYKKGTEDVENMFDDPNLDAALYERVHAYVYRNSILIGTEYVPCKRELLCREVAKQVCSDCDIKSQDLYNEYMQMLERNHLQEDEKLLFPSERAFEARMQDSMYILMKYGRKLRYYVIGEHDVHDLVQALNLERFIDVEISTLKLFKEYPELMDEFDIRDEYELHNLLKKTENEWNSEGKISVNRMPYLVFGNADRQKQTEELMYQLAPISLEEFCEAYENEYGVLRSTASANMVPLISNYLHDGVFAVDQPMLSDEEKEFLDDILVGEFYFTEDVKKQFVAKFGKERADHFNPRTIKEQGYRVYVNYLISNRFSSSADYFSNMITKNPTFDLSVLDRRLIYVQQFNVSFESLRNNLDMIEYEDGKYLRYSHFINVLPEYDKQTLTDYIAETLEYAEGNKYFTIKSLIQDGYDHPLHHIGFGDWFNGALLKNSKRVSFVRTGGTILFYEGTSKKTTVDFLRHVLLNYKSMDIYDLIDLLQEDYGISMFKEKIVQLIKESELYYDSTMEKLYLNKEYFYEEL